MVPIRKFWVDRHIGKIEGNMKILVTSLVTTLKILGLTFKVFFFFCHTCFNHPVLCHMICLKYPKIPNLIKNSLSWIFNSVTIVDLLIKFQTMFKPSIGWLDWNGIVSKQFPVCEPASNSKWGLPNVPLADRLPCWLTCKKWKKSLTPLTRFV